MTHQINLGDARAQTQDLVHARQALYYLKPTASNPCLDVVFYRNRVDDILLSNMDTVLSCSDTTYYRYFLSLSELL